MEKQLFLDFVEKYSLSNTIESVAWEVSNSTLKVRIVSDDKSLLGEISTKNFDSKEFDGHKLGVNKTSEFVNILKVLQDKVEASLKLIGDKAVKIIFTDEKGTKAEYALADLAIIQNVPPMKHIPAAYEVVVKITDDFANTFVKAKNALPDVRLFTVHATAKKAQVILGDTSINTNVITLDVETTATAAIDDISFDANLFKGVLVANKGVEATLKISSEGLATIEYSTDAYTAKYYLVARSTN